MTKVLSILIPLVVVLGVVTGLLYFFRNRIPELPMIGRNSSNVVNGSEIDSFSRCVEAGNAVQESYPRRCTAGDETFTEDIGNELDKMNLVQSESPRPNQLVESPIEIMGTARGYWYFEATFPVILEDANGNIVAQGFATAQDDWMTEDFVPFTGELEFSGVETSIGNLVLQKSNPSGLSENEDELRIPVRFSE